MYKPLSRQQYERYLSQLRYRLTFLVQLIELMKAIISGRRIDGQTRCLENVWL